MRDEEGGQLKAREQRTQLTTDPWAGDRVQGGERFVQEQDAWLAGEGARQRNALTLAARELGWPCSGKMSDADPLQEVRAIAPAGEAHVACDGEVWEQPIVLGDVADAPLLRWEVPAVLGIEP